MHLKVDNIFSFYIYDCCRPEYPIKKECFFHLNIFIAGV